MQRLHRLGHTPSLTKGRHRCSQCQQCWGPSVLKYDTMIGECPKVAWRCSTSGGDVQSNGLWLQTTSIKLVSNSRFIFGRTAVHNSHRCTWHRGVICCLRCGSYTSGKRSIDLVDACDTLAQNRPKTAQKALQRKRFLEYKMTSFPLIGL